MLNEKINRRNFIKKVSVGSAGFMILPSGFISGKNAPSNKLNIALIGAHGRGRAHYAAACRFLQCERRFRIRSN